VISPAIINLCNSIRDAGGHALIVGGWVRDRLRGEPDRIDYDIEVYGLEPSMLRATLASHGTVNTVGEAFTVYKLTLKEKEEDGSRLVVDVSLPRRESKTARGHRGFEVVGDPGMSFEEAARRRDFTINAIMFDPLTEEYIDPHGGMHDLKLRVIRAIDPGTFVEDSLRVLRAMQFASRFEFEVDPATEELCQSIDLDDLPAERIWGEVEKWLLESRHPSIGWWFARDFGIVSKLWPEVEALIECPQDHESHPEGDVFIHTGLVIDEARNIIDGLPRPKKLAVMLGALCHDFGKPSTTAFEEGRIRSRGHEDAGIAPALSFLERLKLSSLDGYDVRGQVLALVAHHLKPLRFYRAHLEGNEVGDGTLRRLALEVEPDLLYRVARADCLGRTGVFTPVGEEWFLNRVKSLGIEERAPAPLLLGRHVLELGIQPGPEVGRVTRAVYEAQLDGKVSTLDEAVAAAREMLGLSD
jgi:tRNA nucleotidyltransferase (CCA-adding enzyme)